MSASKRLQIIQELVKRLGVIQLVNDYNTDAGLAIRVGELPMFSEGDPREVLSIVVGSDSPRHQMEKVVSEWPLEIEAIVPADTQAPTIALENMIADIKRAIEIDHDLGKLAVHNSLIRGQTRVLDREPGSNYVGLGVAYTVQVAEKWGNP